MLDRLLVSIHDVTPALEPQVRALWHLCRSLDVAPALLVVPNWHGVSPLEASPEFVTWVRGCADIGAEIFLHGERHDEIGSPRGFIDEWRAWGKTAREGEFLTLDESAARARIDRGLALFRELGLSPIGFVPPAWLAREDCWRAVSAAGLAFSEDDHVVRVHRRNAVLPSPVVRWSGRTPLRACGSALVASARWHLQRHAPYVRLALHPADLNSPLTTASLKQSLSLWTSVRTASRYADL